MDSLRVPIPRGWLVRLRREKHWELSPIWFIRSGWRDGRFCWWAHRVGSCSREANGNAKREELSIWRSCFCRLTIFSNGHVSLNYFFRIDNVPELLNFRNWKGRFCISLSLLEIMKSKNNLSASVKLTIFSTFSHTHKWNRLLSPWLWLKKLVLINPTNFRSVRW